VEGSPFLLRSVRDRETDRQTETQTDTLIESDEAADSQNQEHQYWLQLPVTESPLLHVLDNKQ
jgi:hypothetical protein